MKSLRSSWIQQSFGRIPLQRVPLKKNQGQAGEALGRSHLFICGLTAVSVLTEYRGSAETYACPPQGVCQSETPPPCESICPDADTR